MFLRLSAIENVLRLRGERRLPLCAAAVLCTALAGCASPGAPRPPSLHLPERADGLTAARRGATVVLRFVAPSRTTDGLTLTAPVTASLCRAVGTEPCHAIESFPQAVGVSAGPVEWVDVLPPSLATGPPRKLIYTVEIRNANVGGRSAGRTAGPSDPAVAAAGDAPRSVEGLRAQGERGGIALRWDRERDFSGEVLLKRETVGRSEADIPGIAKTAAAGAAEKHRGRRGPAFAAPVSIRSEHAEPGVVYLRASDNALANDAGGTVDGTAVPGTLYRYTAVRSRTVTVQGMALELRSAASAPVDFTLRDIYPPAAPVGLMAAAYALDGGAGAAVDLVWQPNSEADLAGYHVYRQSLTADAAGPARKLNDQLLTLPAFHDAGVKPGMHVRYTVVAVDKSGNVSAPSAAADVETAQ